MDTKVRISRDLWLLAGLCLIKLVIHLSTNQIYSFHRDEYLYMDYGRHLSFGYYDVPPLTAFLAWLSRYVLGESVFALRLFPALTGTATLWIGGLLVIELGARRFAVLILGIALIFSALLRVDTMFQPVTFDVFFWTLCSYFLIRFLKYGDADNLVWLGLAFGLGVLNKYTILLWGLGAFTGILMLRSDILSQPKFYAGALLALVLMLPNMVWQLQHHLPALDHVSALSRQQFVHVSYQEIVVSQFMFFGPGCLLWVAGLVYIFTKGGSKFRIMGITYFVTILILLFCKGKSYYAMGMYPALIALGAVYLDRARDTLVIYVFRPVLLLLIMVAGIILLPAVAPVLPAAYLTRYCSWVNTHTGLEFRRWEDGKVHSMPQDFSDMYGWEEGSQKALYWYNSIPEKDRADYIVCASDYGLAASIDFYGRQQNLPEVFNGSSGMIDWVPLTIHAHNILYIGDNVKNDLSYFRHVVILDSITNPWSREVGICIAVATDCKQDLPALWNNLYSKKKAAGPFKDVSR